MGLRLTRTPCDEPQGRPHEGEERDPDQADEMAGRREGRPHFVAAMIEAERGERHIRHGRERDRDGDRRVQAATIVASEEAYDASCNSSASASTHEMASIGSDIS